MIKEIPTNAQSALAAGRTYFSANRVCNKHNTSFHWAATGQCMACMTNIPASVILDANARHKAQAKVRGVNYEYLGEMPPVLVQSPIFSLTYNSGMCAKCGNIIHYLNYEKAICPFCVVKDMNKTGVNS